MTEDNFYAAMETADVPDALLLLADRLADQMTTDHIADDLVTAWVVAEVREVAEGMGAEHEHVWWPDGECRCGAVATGSRRCASFPLTTAVYQALSDSVSARIEPPVGMALLHAVEMVKATGGSVQVAGVRIELCDIYGVTESARAAQAFVDEYHALTSALGYGDGVTEPAASPSSLLDPLLETQATAREHDDGCPEWCDDCDQWEKPRSCPECHGSGCGPGTALGAYEACHDCGGDGRDHEPYTLSGTWRHETLEVEPVAPVCRACQEGDHPSCSRTRRGICGCSHVELGGKPR